MFITNKCLLIICDFFVDMLSFYRFLTFEDGICQHIEIRALCGADIDKIRSQFHLIPAEGSHSQLASQCQTLFNNSVKPQFGISDIDH